MSEVPLYASILSLMASAPRCGFKVQGAGFKGWRLGFRVSERESSYPEEGSLFLFVSE